MTDQRCPSCNRPVTGREEITRTRPRIPRTDCQHCFIEIALVRGEDEGLGEEWFYTLSNEKGKCDS